MSELPNVDGMDAVARALAHLTCALSQTIPTDDQIIVEHMREAAALLNLLMDAGRKRDRIVARAG